MRRIYLQTLTSEKLGLVEEDGRIEEIVLERPEQQSETGNIYIGKITNVEKSLQAAFVSYGGEKAGFLNKKELPQSRIYPDKPIEQLVTQGQHIIVQVNKEALQQKGAVLTSNITIPGTHLVYLPYGGYIAVSKKLDYKKGNELKNKLSELTQGEEGIIIRTSGASVSLVKLEEELAMLRKEWQRLEKRSRNSKVPSLLREERLLPNSLIQKYEAAGIEEIVCDEAETAAYLREQPSLLNMDITWERDWERKTAFSVNQLMDQVLTPYVPVAGGAEIVIEQTEAMVVIDVNSRSQVKKSNKYETAFQVNRNVIQEIVAQIRLRNLSGIILVDFISMKKNTDRQEVIRLLKQELKKDPVRTEVYGFTALGLLEMTRKRETPSVYSLLTEKKQSEKPVMSSRSTAYQLERELILRLKNKSEAIIVEVHPDVYRFFHSILPDSRLPEIKKQNTYFHVTSDSHGYEIKIEGTDQLIEDYIQTKTSWNVDKLF